MNDNLQNNDLQLLTIPQLMDKHFFIPEYQRGYRWEKQQIYQLLEDLWRYFFHDGNKGDFYCLQPIVVKECSQEVLSKYSDLSDDLKGTEPYKGDKVKSGPKNNVWYEVIDGQQRLTTIRILMAFYNEWHFEDHWLMNDKYLEANKKNKFGSYLSNFFNTEDQDKYVHVIWYETKESTDVRDIFERLNNLKVPLSSSELIRAVSLSEKFQTHLDEYVFDEIKKHYNLRLMVESLDLTADCRGLMRQIEDILSRAYNEVLLVGCYRSKEHLDWILRNNLYNVRLKEDSAGILPFCSVSGYFK